MKAPSSADRKHAPRRPWWRLGVAIFALGLVLWTVDRRVAWRHLAAADLPWLGLGVALTIPTTLVMAMRWMYTAKRVGFELPWTVAVSDYYAALLLNQTLPGGVMGDVARVVRPRGGIRPPEGAVLRSVVIERASGQVALFLMLVGSAAIWGAEDLWLGLAASASAFALAGIAVLTVARHPSWSVALGLRRWGLDVRAALWGRAAVVQLMSSLFGVGCLVAIFWTSARAVGLTLTFAQALMVVPWMLAATTLQITVGGWGVREASVVALFDWAQLSGAQGAAASIVYGLVCLAGALPGALLLHRSDRTVEENVPAEREVVAREP